MVGIKEGGMVKLNQISRFILARCLHQLEEELKTCIHISSKVYSISFTCIFNISS